MKESLPFTAGGMRIVAERSRLHFIVNFVYESELVLNHVNHPPLPRTLHNHPKTPNKTIIIVQGSARGCAHVATLHLEVDIQSCIVYQQRQEIKDKEQIVLKDTEIASLKNRIAQLEEDLAKAKTPAPPPPTHTDPSALHK